MEKIMILVLAVLLVAGIRTLPAADIPEGFGTGIKESPHDFSHVSWLPLTGICHVCHTVHNEALASLKYTDGLAWMREINSISYIMYHSYWGAPFFESRFKMNMRTMTGRRSNLPDGLSKICLSCHDGIIAPDVFILHHFVSAEYNVSKTTLRDPDLTEMGISGKISDVLDAGKIQCSSCHDVHGIQSVAKTKLLRVERSQLCITCHKHDIGDKK
jgi:predicted CXXCH cytochrome family protein